MKTFFATPFLFAFTVTAHAQSFQFMGKTTGEFPSKPCLLRVVNTDGRGVPLLPNPNSTSAAVMTPENIRASLQVGNGGIFGAKSWRGFLGPKVVGDEIVFRNPMMWNAIGQYRTFIGAVFFTWAWEFSLKIKTNKNGPVSSTLAWRSVGFKEGNGVQGWRDPVNCVYQR